MAAPAGVFGEGRSGNRDDREGPGPFRRKSWSVRQCASGAAAPSDELSFARRLCNKKLIDIEFFSTSNHETPM